MQARCACVNSLPGCLRGLSYNKPGGAMFFPAYFVSVANCLRAIEYLGNVLCKMRAGSATSKYSQLYRSSCYTENKAHKY